MTLLAIITLALLSQVAAVTIGHEQYGNLPGHFYVFTNGSINIVDPVTGLVNKTISTASVTQYGDSVYLEDQAQLRRYVYAARSTDNKVTVMDADTQTILTSVSVGKKPLHVYALYYNDEVWVHNDLEGSLDVLRMAQVRYRTTSAIKPATTVPGHGKLLFDPNLEKTGFATNVNRGGVLQLSLDSKLIENTILFNASDASQNIKCTSTHGISYGIADNSLYVECSNPAQVPPQVPPVACINKAECTGSIWVYNLAAKTTTRLSSPLLTAKNNIANYGIHGQPYRSPEGTFMFVPNGNEDVVHILKPMSNGAKTQIREVSISKPGTIAFWPKNPSITFGEDANPANYVMAVLCAEGVKFIDFIAVIAAFATEDGKISDSDITTVPVTLTGANIVGGSRSMKRGSDYLVLASYTNKAATSIAIVNIKTRTVKYVPVKYYGTAVWVPIQATENTAMIKSLQAKVNAMQKMVSAQSSASSTSSEDSKSSNMLTNNALIVAAIAFVISLISIILIVILGFVVRKRVKSDGANLL